ncbi:MAG TPA: hypothetical protein VKA26_10265 [Ignavibacteriaceae bacterium]|nr:hypothetical protein [Ignavibacteriaceae bacterium]
MGQQQLLLIVLGIIVVGVSILVGSTMFNSNLEGANRDEIIADMNSLATFAQAYFKKPASLGGGEGSFTGWEMPDYFKKFEAGKIKFKIQNNKDRVVITGTGTEIGVDGKTKVKIKAFVYANDIEIQTKN